MAQVNLKEAYEEFAHLKSQETQRNYDYFLLRQAVKGNFRWPRDWPAHIPKVVDNLCKPITERFVTYLVGKGFTYNVDRPNTLEYRDSAEKTEKILRRLLKLSNADLQFDMGAKTGSQLGRTVFKVYKKGKKGAQHAAFTYCQPDYFYGVPAGDDHLGEFSVVYYSYPIDKAEAKRIYGPGDYKTERELEQGQRYEPLREHSKQDSQMLNRRVPVLEVWRHDSYALIVGGVTIFNGDNPFTWAESGENFLPFVVIENIRNAGEGVGESDVAQARELNERLNQLISRKSYVVQRWLQPTVVWEGAPQNYGELLASSLGGGGAIPTRIGSRVEFLAYDRPNPAVLELEQALRAAILETTGMSEIALQGTVQGSVNTGPALAAQFQPVLSTIGKKQKEWEHGLEKLFSMMLEVQEQIGDSKVLGEAVINESARGENMSDGQLVRLSGKDIHGLRDVVLNWPGVLPKDDFEAARLEMEKFAQGLQSAYTTLEKLGEEYPMDEIARIRIENQDPHLRGEKVAEQMRAEAPLLRAQTEAAVKEAEMQPGLDEEDPFADAEMPAPPGGEMGLGDRLRQLQANRPQLNLEEDEPVIEGGQLF